VEARFSTPVQTGPGAHPASCKMGTGSFLGVKSGQGVTLTPHPLLVSWSRNSRAILLLPLWAVRPVQSLSACTRVHCTFFHHSLTLTCVLIPSLFPVFVLVKKKKQGQTTSQILYANSSQICIFLIVAPCILVESLQFINQRMHI